MKYSTRAQRVKRARQLKDRGISYRQIARDLGVSKSAAVSYITDPELERARELQSNPCPNCGRVRSAEAGALCAQCRGPYTWTTEKIVAAIQDWVERYGELPRSYEWNAGAVRERTRFGSAEYWAEVDRRRAAGRYPSAQVVVRNLGWNEAIRVAGFTPRTRGTRKAAA